MANPNGESGGITRIYSKIVGNVGGSATPGLHLLVTPWTQVSGANMSGSLIALLPNAQPFVVNGHEGLGEVQDSVANANSWLMRMKFLQPQTTSVAQSCLFVVSVCDESSRVLMAVADAIGGVRLSSTGSRSSNT